jgi:DNA-binding transcriptional regulator YhcF (GntR family)
MIETLPGKGFFLKDNHCALTQETRQRLLQTEIDEAVVMAHHLRVDREKFLALVRERLDYFQNKASAAEDGQ